MVDAAQIRTILPLLRWCQHDALGEHRFEELVGGLAEQLVLAGVKVARLNVTLATLHPQVVAQSAVWEEGEVQLIQRSRSAMDTSAYRSSPVRVLAEGRVPRIVEDLRGIEPLRYPALEDFRARGHTGYVAFGLSAEQGRNNLLSVTTRAPEGFSESDLARLELATGALAPVLRIYELRSVAANICRTYLGHATGPRVLAGDIRRGSVETLDAVVWFCDLRGFTALTQELGSVAMVERLNGFFGAVAAAVGRHDGEILKFIGDAALAIFPVRDDPALGPACRAALAAAHDARERVRTLDPSLEFGIGMHVGEVSYGNIGAPDRLDFTVIGPAVNLASRLEALCADLNVPLLASAALAEALDGALVDVGSFQLKGLAEAQRVFGLPPAR